MFRKAFLTHGSLGLTLAALLWTAGPAQAQQAIVRPAGTAAIDRGFFFAPRWYYWGYPYYSNLDYAYAAQQYQVNALRAQTLALQNRAAQQAIFQEAQTELRRVRSQRLEPRAETQVTQPRASASPAADLSPKARAAAKFKLAMVLAAEGQPADAADFLREIVQKYPGTAAAREAQQLLDRGQQR